MAGAIAIAVARVIAVKVAPSTRASRAMDRVLIVGLSCRLKRSLFTHHYY
jgi:hypothetical protein